VKVLVGTHTRAYKPPLPAAHHRHTSEQNKLAFNCQGVFCAVGDIDTMSAYVICSLLVNVCEFPNSLAGIMHDYAPIFQRVRIRPSLARRLAIHRADGCL
jgi:hypothetical protein